MDVLHTGRMLEKEIASGLHGVSGSRFMSVRDIAAHTGCSYVTATRVAAWLKSRCLIRQEGAKSYVTTGRCGPGSELEAVLAKRRRPCLGILLPSADNSFYMSMFECLRKELHSRGFDLFAAVHASEAEAERRQLEMMVSMGMTGILFFSHREFDNHRAFENCPLPVVCLGRNIRGFARSVVSVNNYDVGRLAAQHLMGNGYTSFGYVGMRQAHQMKDMRLKGFAGAIKASGYELDEERIVQLEGEEEADIQRLYAFFSTAAEPVGIFCYHDLLAVSCMKACHALGMRIPQDVGVIGCDDLPIASTTQPGLTTVHYPYGRMAEMSAQILIAELEDGASLIRNITVKPRIIQRDSTRKPAE